MTDVMWQGRGRRLFVVLALGLVTLASLRLLVGSAWVQRKIAAKLADAAQDHDLVLHVGGKIDLGFTGKLTLSNVTVTHPLAQAHLQELSVAPDFLALVLGRPFFAEVVAKQLTVSARGRTLAVQSLDVWAEDQTLQGAGTLGGGTLRVSVQQDEPDQFVIMSDLVDVASTALGMDATLLGRVSLSLSARVAPRLPLVEGDVRASLRDAFIDEPRLASEPVGPLTLGASGHVFWSGASHDWRLDDWVVAFGEQLAPMAQMTVAKEREQLRAVASLDILADDLYEALPPTLSPAPTAPRLQGRVHAQLTAKGAFAQPELWDVAAALDLEDAKQANPMLRESFVHTAKDGHGREHLVLVGPKNPYFVPFAELPEHVVRAVTTSEDAGFFAHHGFDLAEIKNSFIAVSEAGSAVRGGSTITQQLAKNLYLTREKTYARKAQEALITLALEASVRKPRLLEIYLNIIEWGPGIYGLGTASHYYFGKDARLLTPKEAAYLASIIPNPVRFGWHAQKGELTETWEERVLSVLTKMNEAGTLDADAFEAAKSSDLVFSSAN